MKLLVATVLICLVMRCNFAAAGRCLTLLSSKECSKIQELGEAICAKIDAANGVIKETVYRSLDEGAVIIDSAVKYLIKLAAEEKVKIPSPPKVPLETANIFALEATLLSETKTALIDANKKMIALMEKAVKEALGDDAVAKLILGRPASRKRRSAELAKRTSAAVPENLGNTLDGIIERLTPEMEAILTEVDTRANKAFKPISDLFASSIKQLLNGKVSVNFDEVKANMEKYMLETDKVVIQSTLSHLKEVIGSVTQLLIDLSDRTSKFATDKKKISEALEPADMLVSEKVKAASTGTNEKMLLFKIKTSVGVLQLTYATVKLAVST